MVFKSKASYPKDTCELTFQTGLDPDVAIDDSEDAVEARAASPPFRIGSIDDFEADCLGLESDKSSKKKKKAHTQNTRHSAEITITKTKTKTKTKIKKKKDPTVQTFRAPVCESNTLAEDFDDYVLEVKSLDTGKTHHVVGRDSGGFADLSVGEQRRLSGDCMGVIAGVGAELN
ncbi:hypothetical protein ScalyP_jg12012 [Parmales sp. scaly parma]|nr:hypothetical protein ScalyP_jg12012 [Parmales sp. scaly parma]